MSSERFPKRADTDTDTDMITVSVYVSRVLDFVSQNLCQLRELAFIMSVFLTSMTDRDPWPVFNSLHFLIVLLAND